MLLIIREQDGVVARVEGYDGPIPRPGSTSSTRRPTTTGGATSLCTARTS